MKHKIKQSVLLITLLIFSINSKSNSAQPGIWQAGGTGVFVLHYPEDSAGYKKIRMQSEQIYMKLYPGFAVVKGTYVFENLEDTIVSIKVGYPINNVFPETERNGMLNEVYFEDLYAIKANWDDKEAPLLKDSITNWYVWDGSFAPNQKTTFTVYFLVNTNNSHQSQGYNKSYKNSFIYLIETGSLWKSPIDSGDFYVFLDKGIEVESLSSNRNSILNWNKEEKLLYMHLEDYGYKPDDNLVITYNDRLDSFDFNSTLKQSDRYFLELDGYKTKDYKNIEFITFKSESPYKVKGIGNTISSLMVLLISLLPAFGIVIAIYILLKIIKYFSKK